MRLQRVEGSAQTGRVFGILDHEVAKIGLRDAVLLKDGGALTGLRALQLRHDGGEFALRQTRVNARRVLRARRRQKGSSSRNEQPLSHERTV